MQFVYLLQGARPLIRGPLLSFPMNLLNKYSILFPLSFLFLYLFKFFMLNTYAKHKKWLIREKHFRSA